MMISKSQTIIGNNIWLYFTKYILGCFTLNILLYWILVLYNQPRSYYIFQYGSSEGKIQFS